MATRELPRWGRSRKMAMACTIWRAMSGNGLPIGITRARPVSRAAFRWIRKEQGGYRALILLTLGYADRGRCSKGVPICVLPITAYAIVQRHVFQSPSIPPPVTLAFVVWSTFLRRNESVCWRPRQGETSSSRSLSVRKVHQPENIQFVVF